MSGAYYNEHDKFAAAWLRELIKAGLIADGEVDERDIQDVRADDVRGFIQCHFFAGIGGWSYALRLADWPDDRPVWTGSCPCQPFSSAGTREGGHDDRHLWPHWARLIRECQPSAIFGEQVESAIAHGWLDAVFDDLEREGYACGAACLPAGGVGAPHIRQRIWFVAESDGRESCDLGLQRGRIYMQRSEDEIIGSRLAYSTSGGQRIDRGAPWQPRDSNECGASSIVGQSERRDQRRYGADTRGKTGSHESQARPANGHSTGSSSRMGNAINRERRRFAWDSGIEGACRMVAHRSTAWDDCRPILCRDGKTRFVEPSIEPLAHGVSNRVGRLRGYGNAIVPPLAAAFIQAYCECSEVKS